MRIKFSSGTAKLAIAAMLAVCLGAAGCGATGDSNTRYKGKEIQSLKANKTAQKRQQFRQGTSDPVSEVIESDERLNDPLPARRR